MTRAVLMKKINLARLIAPERRFPLLLPLHLLVTVLGKKRKKKREREGKEKREKHGKEDARGELWNYTALKIAAIRKPDAGRIASCGQCNKITAGNPPLFPVAVWVAGLAAAGASALLAILVGLAVLQLAMASSAKRVVISYSTALIGKVALATLASEYEFLYIPVYMWEHRPQVKFYVRGLPRKKKTTTICFNVISRGAFVTRSSHVSSLSCNTIKGTRFSLPPSSAPPSPPLPPPRIIIVKRRLIKWARSLCFEEGSEMRERAWYANGDRAIADNYTYR